MNDPVIVGLVLIVFLLFAFTFKKGIKYLGEVLRNSLNVKERQNLFNDTTVRETQLRAVLLIMTFISEGFCLFELVSRHIPSLSEMIGIGICCGGVIAFCYYYLQKWIYTGIGRLFTDATHTRRHSSRLVDTRDDLHSSFGKNHVRHSGIYLSNLSYLVYL